MSNRAESTADIPSDMVSLGPKWRKLFLITCGVWLGLNAVLHLLSFPFLLYAGLCTLLMPVSLWIICSLTTNLRNYLLLQSVPTLLCVIWWQTTPLLGLMFSLPWLVCILPCGAVLKQIDQSLSYRSFLYLLALLPFAALLPLFFFILQAVQR